MAGKNPLLAAEDLSVLYRGQKKDLPALRGLSFTVDRGQTLGIIGESGSGKTTLALALFGLIGRPHRVGGRVIIGGQDLLALPEAEKKKLRWRKAGLVFQNSRDVLNPVLKVGLQVAEPLQKHLGMAGEALRRRVDELFALVGLERRWQEAYPHQLSGGMLQRALLAMALSCDPELLVLDEPTASLDAVSQKQVLSLLRRIRKQRDKAMIIISHDLSVVAGLADDLLVLYGGEVLEYGPVASILEEPYHPYTRGLLNSCAGLFPHRDLWGIPGEPPSQTGDSCSFSPRCTQAGQACRESRPVLAEAGPGRLVRCHRGGITTLLLCRNISKTFGAGRRAIAALDRASLTVRHGETVALVGASGSGKSTLAQVLAGLLRPDGGEIIFRGEQVRDNTPARREGGIQLVLQDPFVSLSHRLTVAQAVGEPLAVNGIGTREAQRKRVEEALLAVQLPANEDFLNRFCYALSGGQRQRLAVARALVMRPALLLADEITSMLDVSTQANLLRLLKGLQNSRGFAMLYITHDLQLARKVAERIVVLHQGKVVEEGSARRVSEGSCCHHTRELMEAGLSKAGWRQKP